MSLIMYWYPKCGTCRNAHKWLAARGIETQTIDLVLHPPARSELEKLVERSGLELNTFFNTSGELYRELQLKDKLPGLSRDEKLDLLAKNGKLIKRPIVTDGERVTVGFKEGEFARVWGHVR